MAVAKGPTLATVAAECTHCIIKFTTISSTSLLRQGSYSFELIKFHDYPRPIPCLFPIFHVLKFRCHFWKSSLFLGNFQKKLACIIFYPSFDTCNNLRTPHTVIFHAFPCPTIKFYDFSGFPWPLWTLVCNNGNQNLLTVLSSQVWPLQANCGHTWKEGKHTSVTRTLNTWIRGHWCTIIIIIVHEITRRQ